MKRHFLKQLAVLAAACLAAPLVSAQANYPDRPIRFIVPFPPGASVDPIARVVGQKLGEVLGQTIIVDNRPGGNMAIGAGFVAKAAPDGYNLLFTALATHVIHTMQTSLPYDSIKDFAPISMVSRSAYMMAIHTSVPAKTMPEFVAYAKANPGKLNFGSSGVGNLNHLAVELFNLRAGTKIVHVPYKGGSQALQDLITGRVQVMISNVPVLQPQVDAGNLRALAYTSQAKGGPVVPTFTQLGFPDLDAIESLNVLMAPAGTPEPIIAKLNAALQKVLTMPDVITAIENQKQTVVYSTSALLGERMRSDRAKYAEILDKANIKLTP
ncbi:MAG: tripartite tricarboxylate transporter substrate binding protein [Pseudomonadota bacterium]